MFIDCHCHLDFYKDEEIKEIVERARKKGVGIIVDNGVDPRTNRRIIGLSEKYTEIKPSLGLYPIDAISISKEEVDKEINFIRENKGKIVAIGEVGIDFKESEKKEEQVRQEELFDRIVKLAIKLDKPLIVHSRKAEKECIEILEKNKAKKVIMHCFNGNLKLVKRIEENSWFLTIPTNVTFSEHFQKVIGQTKIENLLCETDSPYLHPEKKRNNEPGNVIESYKKIAEIKGMKFNDVEEKIGENYRRLFE